MKQTSPMMQKSVMKFISHLLEYVANQTKGRT